ncbi:MAG TPA: hypothetical protein VMW94_06525, partial [Actinomycetes bacterium]|nr:hypothetical protein [Actinomycetes bacterium]
MTGGEHRPLPDRYKPAAPTDLSSPRAASAPPEGGEAKAPAATKVADVEPDEPVIKPLAVGNTATATLPDGSKVAVRYEVVRLRDLVKSHGVDLRKNPEYDPLLQGRQRERQAYETALDEMLRPKTDPNGKGFDAAQMGVSKNAADGAPIVANDGHVESGNGRGVMAERFYTGRNIKPEWAEANLKSYHEMLREELPSVNIDPDTIPWGEEPVLIRRRTTKMTPDERYEFARRANGRQQADMSAVEVAVGDGRSLAANPDVMQKWAPSADPDIGMAINAASNSEFRAQWVDKIIPPNERNELVDSHGYLSKKGIERVTNSLLVYAYGDNPGTLDVLTQMTESPHGGLKNIGHAIIRSARSYISLRRGVEAGVLRDLPAWEPVTRAIAIVREARSKGTIPNDIRRQRTFDEAAEDSLDTIAANIAAFMEEFKGSAPTIANALDKFAAKVIQIGDPKNKSIGDLLGDSDAETLGPLWLLAEREAVSESTRQRTAQRKLGEEPAPGEDDPVPPAGGAGRGNAGKPRVEPPPLPPGPEAGGAKPAGGEPRTEPLREPGVGEPTGGPSGQGGERRSGTPARGGAEPGRAPVAADRGPGGSGRPGLVVVGGEHLPEPGEALPAGRWSAELDAPQRLGVNLALRRFKDGGKGFLLADGTGTGKTRQILAVAEVTAEESGKPTLIITNSQATIDGSFAADARAMGVSLPSRKIEVGTYDSLRSGKSGRGDYGLVVFDEAHNLKNVSAAKTTAANSVRTDRKLFATATPLDRPTGASYFLAELTGRSIDDVQRELGFTIYEESV